MNDEFHSFYSEVKSIEKEDSKYTSEQQINRLLIPGSTYANLNPFEVLLVEPEDSTERIKKQYKKLSILVHPDKNPHDADRAQKAFDAVTKAFKTLGDEKGREKVLEIVEEAKFKVNKNVEDKKRKLKLEKRDTKVEEDDPIKLKQAIRVMTMKLFAEYERKRRMMEDRAQEERKRKREEEIEQEKSKEQEQEWQRNFEESRQSRVKSWQTFTKKTKYKRKDIRPPKHKAEARN